jgi:hypothetical protein
MQCAGRRISCPLVGNLFDSHAEGPAPLSAFPVFAGFFFAKPRSLTPVSTRNRVH